MGTAASYRAVETYFYVRPAGRSPESTLGYFAPSRLLAMMGQQPVGLSSELMNFKPFVCDQVRILPPQNNCTASLLRRADSQESLRIFLTGIRVRGSNEERVTAEILTHRCTRESDDEDHRDEPHPRPVNFFFTFNIIEISLRNHDTSVLSIFVYKNNRSDREIAFTPRGSSVIDTWLKIVHLKLYPRMMNGEPVSSLESRKWSLWNLWPWSQLLTVDVIVQAEWLIVRRGARADARRVISPQGLGFRVLWLCRWHEKQRRDYENLCICIHG